MTQKNGLGSVIAAYFQQVTELPLTPLANAVSLEKSVPM